ncbi:tetratricopeptide repeat protein [Candidatus Omnitrophota bacterium]
MRRLPLILLFGFLCVSLACPPCHSFIFKKDPDEAKAKKKEEPKKRVKAAPQKKAKSPPAKVKQDVSGNGEKADLKKRVEELKQKIDFLTKDYKELIEDRDNLAIQARKLVSENRELEKFRGSVQSATEEKDAIKSKYEARAVKLEKENRQLRQEMEPLKARSDAVKEEITQLQKVLLRMQSEKKTMSVMKKDAFRDRAQGLSAQLEMMKREKAKLLDQMNKSQKRVAILETTKSKIREVMEDLQGRLDILQEKYARMKKENEMLDENNRVFPKKFADLARQNKDLVKETADMHYNLGVFYVRNKEYKRAAREFEKVLDFKPTDADTYYNLGFIYAEHIVDRVKSIKYFTDYLKYAPDSKDADWVRKYIITWQMMEGKRNLN